MIAAIYARKSTDQPGVAEPEKSVTRQIAQARAYAATKGWTIAEAHVYADDGISGAEFLKRPDFLRLMNALKPRPAFQALIISEPERVGREQGQTAIAFSQLIEAGVQVWSYLEDKEWKLETATDKFMLNVANFTAELEREKASLRTRDAMVRKAKAGHVTGGVVYGYTNHAILSPEGKRLHVVRRPHAEQAAVVRQIFERYAAGSGIVAIAKQLNREHVAAPRGRGWAPTCIREILYRETYCGVVVWGRSQKLMRKGTKASRKRPEAEWLRLPAPELQIVPAALWETVHARLEHKATQYPRQRAGGRLIGRPGFKDGESRYLLTGFAECSVCKGSVGIDAHMHGPKANRRSVPFYTCMINHRRGEAICATQNHAVRQDVVEHAVLQAISDVLDERILDGAVDRALARLRAGQGEALDRRGAVERELALLQHRIERGLDTYLAGEGPMDDLKRRLKEDDTKKKALTAELERLAHVAGVASLDTERVKHELRSKVADVRALLGRHIPQARQMLRRLLVGKITMEPINQGGKCRGYRFRGALTVERLLSGEVFAASSIVVAPTGFEPVFQP